jgi:hypothetical protein
VLKETIERALPIDDDALTHENDATRELRSSSEHGARFRQAAARVIH